MPNSVNMAVAGDPRPSSELGFLAGGGEMGARMRALDWTRTPLGVPSRWPQSLKTIVRVMLDSRYAMWMLWGPELTFFCNDAYLPTVGIKASWVLGARSDKVWEEIWPDIGPRITQVLELGQATWDEGLLLFLERSGFAEETYHTFSYSPVYNDESRIAGMLCVVTEVTNRVIGERRLRVLRDLAAHPVGLESVDRSCERSCEVLGQSRLDTPFAALYLRDADAPRLRRAAHTTGAGGTLPATLDIDDPAWPVRQLMQDEANQELNGLPRMGITIPSGPWPDLVQRALLLPLKCAGSESLAGLLMVGISPRRPLDGEYRSFLELVARQIASAIGDARAYETQRRRAEALAEIDRAKTVFFSNVSHEFRTPLTLMLGPLEQMTAEGGLPLAAREQLHLVHRNSLRLLKLVNSLLDFARIEAGRVHASFEPADLAALTRDLASTFRSAIERAGLAYVVDCEDLGEPVYIDREMWEKIVLNLLSNAFKFTLRGQIAVGLRRDHAHAVLTVADTGVGIADEEIPRLFERFHRVEGGEARTREGSGIGLALVQELVKLHGAAVDVMSEPGRGTTFSVRVPLGAAHLPPESVHAARPHSIATLGARAFVQEALRWLPDAKVETTATLPTLLDPSHPVRDPRFAATFGARVLLADDNADMRAYVRELLTPAYAIEAVADGEQALAAARRERPDLILTDVMMPRLDGFGLLAAIREDESLRSVPVVILSARAGEEARIEGFDAGADDYLVKPFSARELIARVGALLELGNMRREAEHALRLRTAQLQDADRQKDEFLAMLAHELRNPLAPIQNASALLAAIAQHEPRVQFGVGVIKRQVTQLTRLVDDLLDVSRITQGRIELKREPLELGSIIAQAIEVVDSLIREQRHKVSIAAGYQPLYVLGDNARLVQCVGNVLTNAAKYTDPDGEIKIRSYSSGTTAVLEITDNGVGISPDLLPRIFDLFVQSERTLDRSQGGLGIGLSVVKRLVEMHGGQVQASSEGLGRGATFEIRLPLIERPRAPVDLRPESRLSRQKILIVDDNVDAADTLALLLELEGHETQAVYLSTEAIERATWFKPDVVLLDIGLPVMNGYELAQKFRSTAELAGVRLVALTGYGKSEDQQRAKAAGFDDHLVKPVDAATLNAALAQAARDA